MGRPNSRKDRNNCPDIGRLAGANSAYTFADLPHLKSLDQLHLMMIELLPDRDDLPDHPACSMKLKRRPGVETCLNPAPGAPATSPCLFRREILQPAAPGYAPELSRIAEVAVRKELFESLA